MAGQAAQQGLRPGLAGPGGEEAVDQRLLAGPELLPELGDSGHVRR